MGGRGQKGVFFVRNLGVLGPGFGVLADFGHFWAFLSLFCIFVRKTHVNRPFLAVLTFLGSVLGVIACSAVLEGCVKKCTFRLFPSVAYFRGFGG